jgi:ComF family protein
MPPIAGGVCYVCGERLVSVHAAADGAAEALCGLCRQEHPAFARPLAYGTYDGGLRELIHLLKYEHVRPASNVLGRMLAEVITGLETAFTGPVLLIPVPLHKRKLRERGFNQSEMIATAALKVHGGAISIVSELMERRRETDSQIGLTRNQRRENIRGAFAVTRPQALAGSEVLLVDDVFTTGTTASECARVLLRAGAAKVWVATVARTLKHNTALAETGLEESESVAAMAAHG